MESLRTAGQPARAGTLYVVATPLGNLRDVTLRALDVLASVDVIGAEDTRVSAVLLRHYGIPTRPVSIREHNEQRRAAEVVGWLVAGRSVALITDAGTPGISDPGARVVAAAHEAGLPVVPVPGACGVRASPDTEVAVQLLPPAGARPCGLRKLTSVSCPCVRVRPLE